MKTPRKSSIELTTYILNIPSQQEYTGLDAGKAYARESSRLRNQAATLNALAGRMRGLSNEKAARKFEGDAERSLTLSRIAGSIAAGTSIEEALNEAFGQSVTQAESQPEETVPPPTAQIHVPTNKPEIIRVAAARLLHNSEQADIPRHVSVYELSEGEITGTFEHDGQLFAALGTMLEPNRRTYSYVRAIRLVAPSEYAGETHTYGPDNPLVWRDAIRYEGCMVRVRNTDERYVMTGGMVHFMPIEDEQMKDDHGKGPKEILSLIRTAATPEALRDTVIKHAIHNLSRFRRDSQERIITTLLAKHLELHKPRPDAFIPTTLSSPVTVPARRLEYTSESSGDILAGVDAAFTTERFITNRFFAHERRAFIGVGTLWEETASLVCTEVHAHEILPLGRYAGHVHPPDDWLSLPDKEKADPNHGLLFLLCDAPAVLIGTPLVFRSEEARDPNEVEPPVGDDTDITQAIYTARHRTPPFYRIMQAIQTQA